MSNILDPSGNGAPRKLKPCAVIFWDPEKQAATYEVDPTQVKTWEFGKALLMMATEYAEKMQNVAAMQQMAQAQQDQAIARQVMSGR